MHRKDNVMNPISIARFVASGVLAATLFPFVANASESQDQAEIVVRSEGAITTEVGRSNNNFPIVLVEKRHIVEINDLNLTTGTDADALVKLVRSVARKGCAELDFKLPYTNPDPSCVRDAVEGAMPQIEAAIAEAKARSQAS
jgi:UrcA family protein